MFGDPTSRDEFSVFRFPEDSLPPRIGKHELVPFVLKPGGPTPIALTARYNPALAVNAEGLDHFVVAIRLDGSLLPETLDVPGTLGKGACRVAK